MASTANKRTPVQIEYDRAEIARRYLKGELQSVIAESLGMTQQMVSYDLQRIREQWIQSALVDFNEVQSRELARIDLLEREYWTAWDRSCSRRTSVTRKEARVKTDDEDQDETALGLAEVTTKTEERDGNPQFLAGVQWCIEQRCKIFGLYEPEKFAIVDWRREAEEKGIDVTGEFERLVERFAGALQEGGGEDGGGSVAGSKETDTPAAQD